MDTLLIIALLGGAIMVLFGRRSGDEPEYEVSLFVSSDIRNA